MKKIIFAAMAIVALAACSKTESDNPKITQNGLAVSVTFDKGRLFDTRAFFDNTAEAEPYEKAIISACIYVFDSQGVPVMRKMFSATEVENLSAKLMLPERVAGEECTFYVIANYGNFYSGNFEAENQILDRLDYTAWYNGAFELASTGQVKYSGFTMSDSRKAVVQPEGTPTNVSFVLKRTVAKVAIKVSVDEIFAAQLGLGKVFVNSIKVSNAPTQMAVFANTTLGNVTNDFSYLQKTMAVGGEYCNLFYLSEMPPASGNDRVMLQIIATYDADGNDNTKDDQIPLEWDMWFNGTGNGEIRRNTYYRIGAVIRGLTDALEDIRSSIEVADWETPVTQETVFLD